MRCAGRVASTNPTRGAATSAAQIASTPPLHQDYIAMPTLPCCCTNTMPQLTLIPKPTLVAAPTQRLGTPTPHALLML